MNISWKLKSAIFSFIDLISLPQILYFLQKNITKRSRITEIEVNQDWRMHSESLIKYNAIDVVFEFGAGKNLAQNLFLSNVVKKQIVVDLNPMIDFSLVEKSRDLMNSNNILRLEKEIHNIDDLLEYGIEYKAPFDASSTDFADSSFDACVSTNTLEHIPKNIIFKIFNELHRTLKSDGIVSAKIDYSDHYAHTDSSISLLNYLIFSESAWKKYNHACHYQNRLRHYDYLDIIDQCGFHIVEENLEFREVNVPNELSIKFEKKPDSWAATSSYLVFQKK